ARPFVEEYRLRGGRRVFLLGEGRLINLASAEGHPAMVMDMSFANQALSVEHLVEHASTLEKSVHGVPEAIDKEVARLKLKSMGTTIDTLRPAQVKYLAPGGGATEPEPLPAERRPAAARAGGAARARPLHDAATTADDRIRLTTRGRRPIIRGSAGRGVGS